MATETAIAAFTIDDIEDVRIIIKAKGKHFGLVPKLTEFNAEETKALRIAMLQVVLDSHYVVDRALEDIKTTRP